MDKTANFCRSEGTGGDRKFDVIMLNYGASST